MTLCQAFVKLGEQCDDFSAWKGSEISGSYGKFHSSLEVEGTLTSFIKESMGDRSFLADLGSFESEYKAVEKVESLKKEILTCYPLLKFADTKGSFSESLSYFVPEYGYSQSADGMSVSFVHADRPYNVAGILYIEKIMDGYNMNLSLKAEPKPVM